MADVLILGARAWLALGLATGLWFQWRGWARALPGKDTGGLPFRLMLLPSLVLLWPLALLAAHPRFRAPGGRP